MGIEVKSDSNSYQDLTRNLIQTIERKYQNDEQLVASEWDTKP